MRQDVNERYATGCASSAASPADLLDPACSCTGIVSPVNNEHSPVFILYSDSCSIKNWLIKSLSLSVFGSPANFMQYSLSTSLGMLTVLSSTIIISSFCLGTNDFSKWSMFSDVTDPDDWSETDELWLVIADWDVDAIPADIASWAGNFWYLCETTRHHKKLECQKICYQT